MTQLQELLAAADAFRDARDWRQFHNPKDLALSLTLEAAEVLEHFQWKNGPEVARYLSEGGKGELQKEIADVMILLLFLADAVGVDLERAVLDKLEENSRKYPLEKAKGRAVKYDKL
jgi:NTP pyrophosphatase (non-canonical NTP hydrolase)